VPNAADDWAAAIHGNNTQCLVADVERLRSHLAVEAWHVVLGGSWGSTLALAYAQAHPSKLKAIVLRGVFLFLPQEVDNLFQDGSTALNHPEAWELYVDHIRASSPSAEAFALEEVNLLAAYYSRLVSQDAETRLAAAAAFVKYELTISKTFPDAAKVAKVMAYVSSSAERARALPRVGRRRSSCHLRCLKPITCSTAAFSVAASFWTTRKSSARRTEDGPKMGSDVGARGEALSTSPLGLQDPAPSHPNRSRPLRLRLPPARRVAPPQGAETAPGGQRARRQGQNGAHRRRGPLGHGARHRRRPRPSHRRQARQMRSK